MIPSLTFSVWLVSAFQVCLVNAGVSSNWTNPNAHLPSFSSSFLVGERILLSWLSLNNSRDDLWLTRYDDTTDNYSLRITSDLDLSTDGSFAWTVAVADEVVLADTRFVFNFVPIGSLYDAQVQMQLQSPAFNIMIVNQATAPNGTVGASPSATPSKPHPSLASSSNTSDSQSHKGDTGTTNMAKNVGIAAAVLAVVALAGFIVGYVVFKKRYNRRNLNVNLGDGKSDITLSGPYRNLGDRKLPAELTGGESHIHELTVSKETKTQDDTMVHEASTIIKRPGLHEMAG